MSEENAAQMAQCASLINNFLAQEDLPRVLEKEELPASLSPILDKFILISNLCPVKLAIHLTSQETSELLEHSEKVYRLLNHFCEKVMKQSGETNEVLGIKFHYLAHVVKECGKAWAENKSLDKWIKGQLRGRESDGFPIGQEELIRSCLKDFPHRENQLIQQLCRTLDPVTIGNEPTALNVLTSAINGQRMASEDDHPCNTCMDFFATKKCSSCNMVMYCNQRCQKLQWSQHKKYCKTLAAEYKRLEKMKEEEKKEDENKENGELQTKKGEQAGETTNGTYLDNDCAKLKATESGVPGMGGTDDIGMPDLEVLLKDPEVIAAFQNPTVAAAFKDISQNPANIAKYQNEPEVKDIMDKIAQKYCGGADTGADACSTGDPFDGAEREYGEEF